MAKLEICSKCRFERESEYGCQCSKCITSSDFTGFVPKTNADRIRSMSDEELAEFLIDHHNYPCKYCVHCWKDSENDVGCKGALMRWLKSEVKE